MRSEAQRIGPGNCLTKTQGCANSKDEVYGLEEGQTDEEGNSLFSSSSNWFSYREHVDGEKESDKKSIDDNNNKIDKYLQYLYVNDPDQKMFWPIWKVFIDSSNGLLKNDYDY